MIKISVITVTYNAADLLKDTIESVFRQTCRHMEYLVLDGQSSDQTIKIAKSYVSGFLKKGIQYSVICETDDGIYDAMNKSMQYVHGDYVLFLNAGDSLASDQTIETAVRQMECEKADIFYGDVILKRGDYLKHQHAKDIAYIRSGMPFCHQCAFIGYNLMKSFQYDLQYKVCADRDFFMRCFLNGKSFFYLNEAVSIYLLGGMSSKDASKTMKLEEAAILLKYGYLTEQEYEKRMIKIDRQHWADLLYERIVHICLKMIPSISRWSGWVRKDRAGNGIW